MSFFINFQGTAVVEATMIAAATVEAAAAMIDTEYRTLLHVSSFAFHATRTQNGLLMLSCGGCYWLLLLFPYRLVLHSLLVLFTLHVSNTRTTCFEVSKYV
jgi:hypothetical protein